MVSPARTVGQPTPDRGSTDPGPDAGQPAPRPGRGSAERHLELGFTTSALPPPSLTGSAIASARPRPSICSAVASPG